jgi:hypothetical protein
LAQAAALALWDTISSSVRMRPTEAPRATVALPLSASLGAVASAGDICPQTGWWQCNEGGNGVNVLGGQCQFMRQGQLLPQALLLPPPTLWEKVRGLQRSFESQTSTAWKLVDRRNSERVAPAVGLDKAKPGSPAAFAALTNQAKGEKAAIGSYVTTGSPCPASGWWRSEDSHALDGSRWFAEGSLLPAATFTLPSAVSGKSADASKTIQRRGKWQLMRLAQTPDSSSGVEGTRDPAHAPVEPDRRRALDAK